MAQPSLPTECRRSSCTRSHLPCTRSRSEAPTESRRPSYTCRQLNFRPNASTRIRFRPGPSDCIRVRPRPSARRQPGRTHQYRTCLCLLLYLTDVLIPRRSVAPGRQTMPLSKPSPTPTHPRDDVVIRPVVHRIIAVRTRAAHAVLPHHQQHRRWPR